MDMSPRLSLTYVAQHQAQKHVSVNETFRRLDALVQLRVLSRAVSAEPSAPAEGDAYILPDGRSGAAWSGFSGKSIAVFQDGAWVAIAPSEGYLAYVSSESGFCRYAAGNWAALASGSAESAPTFGVNTTADATSRLAVKSNASFFSHDDVSPGTGDHRLTINKSSSAKTASVIFSDGASGRAEIGLAGDDHLRVKVSPDGAAFNAAMSIRNDNGFVGIGTMTPAARLALQIDDNAYASALRIENVNAGAAAQARIDLVTQGGSGLFMQQGPILYFWNIANGPIVFAANNAQKMQVTAAGCMIVGSPTGGDKGAGTINAQAVYDDNALLSCYVLEAALDGAVDLERWDALAPDGRHAGARRFADTLASAHDPLTLDGYAAHWREKRHLPALPNEAGFDPAADKLSTGEWIQRLVETVETHAVLIETLNQRLKPAVL
jgi:hypothetical protein